MDKSNNSKQKKGEGEAEDKGGVQAGHETSDKLLFHRDWIRREHSKKNWSALLTLKRSGPQLSGLFMTKLTKHVKGEM